MCFAVETSAADREPTRDNEHSKCKVTCCKFCSYCARAFSKERNKSRGSSLLSRSKFIKICERCFLCHSIVSCKYCNKCSQCCHKSTCRGQTAKVLGKVVRAGCRSESCSNPEGGLHPSLPDPAKLIKNSNSCKLLWQSSQEPQTVRGITSAYGKKCYRTGTQTNLTRVLQPTIPGSQTQQQMEANPRFEQSESFSQNRKIQDGDPGNHQNFSPTGRMGNLHRLQGCIFPHSDTGIVKEILEISHPGTDLSVQSSPFRSIHSSHGVHCHSKGGKAYSHSEGYKDPPIPRRLVGASHIPPGLSPAYTGPSTTVQTFRLAGEHRKVGIGTQTSFQLRRLPIRPPVRSGPTDTGQVAKPTGKDTRTRLPTGLFSTGADVLNRPANSYREASSSRQTTHEAHSVAPQKKLENTGIVRKMDPSAQISTSSPTMVAGRRQRSHRPTTTPSTACSANLYRRIKRRVGRSLKRVYCQRNLVPTGKQIAHKLLGTKSSLFGSKRVPKAMHRQNGAGCDRQYHRSGLYQQGRRHEVGPTLCPTLENLDLVHREASDSEGTTHSRPLKCSGRQTVQIRSDHPNRMVPPARNLPSPMRQVASASNRSICYEVQQQAAPVCITGSGPHGHCSGCTQFVMGRSGRIRLPTDSHIGQSGGEVARLPIPEADHYCPGVAQHDVVLGPSGNVQPDPIVSTSITKPTDSALQSDPSQESDKPKSPRMAPRATAIKEQGFSEAVATRIEAPQRGSTRSVYEAKWAILTKWCITNQVDFRTPPVKSVADFLMYLFEERKLQPSTIDGYRSAIADKLGSSTLNISKDENLTRLLDSFHRDRPKGRRGTPSWNLSLVLHQLTKAPFEPIREASLKHLTFKTVFLLALGSGKRRSEIHAWQHKNIRHQSDWTKISLYPSPSFLSKNQLAKEGPDSVAPVVIPALAPTLDRSLKSDRSLCPVRALRYYLDRTSDFRQNAELVFVSFKKGFDKDISPATISSWIKQTVILCYELSDQEAHKLHQVKAHDVRAFAASKAFQSGVSLEQILSACHWKSHNTFTQFYLKDVAWADSELYHLGPVVAADPHITQAREEICTYVYSVYIVKKH